MIFSVCVAGAVLILIGGRIYRIQAKGKLGEMRVRALLLAMGARSLNDIVIKGKRGLTQIDHVALTQTGLLVIETKNYSGDLYDNGRRRSWIQVLGRAQNTLHNPQDQNYGHRRAVMGVTGLGNDAVFDVVVLAGDARFPKGAPEGVMHLKSVRAYVRTLGGTRDIPSPYKAAFDRLTAAVLDSKADRAAQLRKVTGGGYKYWMQAHGGWIAAAGFGIFTAGIMPW